MTLRVQLSGDSDQLLTLESALRGDSELRGTRVQRIDVPPAPGELGPVTDALQWVSDNGELLSALAGALTAWLSQRRTTVTVKIGDREVVVDSTKVRDPEALALQVLLALEGDGTAV
ncbi:effector-associated constant component EACC1 [Catellatospora tritici]|uniref:effector-associated constant component EACC1 n=1 Tax=Catellatospora tritici TaxID=2851566 RepID=UPI001C2CE442|nr:hypothetical protein [Catellatospora tritici]MBV1848930.1 hypothetical protein [Catellatospora tritici]